MNITIPNYHRIYTDILKKKYPQKKDHCNAILQKTKLSTLDIIQLNEKIFGTHSPKHHSYTKTDIFKILDYQKKHNLNNSQLANHFKLSRNTVAKWKKYYI